LYYGIALRRERGKEMQEIKKSDIPKEYLQLYEQVEKAIRPSQLRVLLDTDKKDLFHAVTEHNTDNNFIITLFAETAEPLLLTRELLRIYYNKKVLRRIVYCSDVGFIAIIASEIQNLLDQKWIVAEQKRRFPDLDVNMIHANLRNYEFKSETPFIELVKAVICFTEVMVVYPDIYEENRTHLEEKFPREMEYARQLASCFPKDPKYEPVAAKGYFKEALDVIMKIFEENDQNPNQLQSIFLAPIFTKRELTLPTEKVLGYKLNFFYDRNTKFPVHAVYTLKDNSVCALLPMPVESEIIASFENDFKLTKLSDFLKMAKIEYFVQ